MTQLFFSGTLVDMEVLAERRSVIGTCEVHLGFSLFRYVAPFRN